MFGRTLLLLLLSKCLQNVLALNILAIASMPLPSHSMAFKPLFRELANRGHNVTVLNNYPDKEPTPNLKFVNMARKQFLNLSSIESVTPVRKYETADSTYLHLCNFYRHYELSLPSNKADCENFFTHELVKAHFAEGLKYDVIFVEQFMGDCGLAYAGTLYDAPIIGITSHVLLPLAYQRLGIPFDYSSDAFYFSKAGPNPSLYYKTETFLLNLFYNTIGRWYIQRCIYEIFNRYLPNNNLDIERVAKERIKMMFAYQHFSVTGARLLPPQVLEIGGIHIGKPGPVPENIERFLSSAKHGAIYVSFGSNLKASTMSRERMQIFLNAFKKVPQKVLWKYENANFTDKNVLTQNWFPQLDILCHSKVVGFVSHGGMLSLSETTHCGKPVLIIPFFGDQFSNGAAVQTVGIGDVLFFDKVNADTLAAGIKKLTSQEIQHNATKISKLWHDRPMSVMDSAIYWTEYVARHGSAPPALPSQRTTWFEGLLLDVAAVLIGLVLVSCLILFTIFKIVKLGLVIFKQKSKKE